MQKLLTDRDLLESLAVEVELTVRRHIDAADEWQPHDYVPWDDGRNFTFLGGADWEPGQSELSETARLALTVSVLIADNLPSYHREVGKYLRTGAWWRWVGRWTAEEAKTDLSRTKCGCQIKTGLETATGDVLARNMNKAKDGAQFLESTSKPAK